MDSKEDTHCYECAGKAKARGEECSTCDGEGNLRKKVKSREDSSKQKRY